MRTDKLNEWLTLAANAGVLIGIVFLVFELRANTASNRIALSSQFSTNWVELNGDVATNPSLAKAVHKARSSLELDEIELIQIEHFINQRLAQAALMRRLYQEGFATRDDVHRAYLSLRALAQYETFREAFRTRGNSRNQRMILEEDGIDWWLDAIDAGETID